jgi:ferredoxin-type protein NapG
LEYGFVRLNTPVLSFKNGYCNSCMKCPQVCPTGALLPVSEETLDIGAAVIIKKDCVAWDWVGCTVCVDKCPLKAICLDENKCPVVVPEKCNGCGICQFECPSTSFGYGRKGKGIIVEPRGFGVPAREGI